MDVCDVPLVGGMCDAAGNASEGWLGSAVAGGARLAGSTASLLFESMWQIFEATTVVDITSGRFTAVYNLLFGIAVFVMLAFFLIQVITGMIRREPAALTRAALGMAKSILGSFIVLTLIAAALAITDQLTIGIVHATGTTMEELGTRIALLATGIALTIPGAPVVGALLTLFVASLAIGAAFIIWMSLLVRKALLLVAIVFAPIAMAGLSWDATRGWVSRWATFVVALIVSKLVIVVFFLLATAQANTPITTDLQSLSDPISGVVLMLVAGFAPYLTYKAINFMGVDFYHAMSTEQEAKHALNRPLPVPSGISRPSPPSVLTGSKDSGTGSTPAPASGSPGTPRAPAPAAPATGGLATGSARGGAAAAGTGAAAATGIGAALAGGAILAKGAWDAGRRTGQTVAGAAERQHDAGTTPSQEGRR